MVGSVTPATAGTVVQDADRARRCEKARPGRVAKRPAVSDCLGLQRHYVASGGSNPPSLNIVEWPCDAPPTVLVHGFAECALVWSDFATRSAGRSRSFAIDLRGHGDSEWDTQSRYDMRLMVSDLIAAWDALELGRARLVGHSMGAEVALRFTAAFPERIERLVLVDFGPEAVAEAVAHIHDEFVTMPRYFASKEAYYEWLAARRPLAATEVLRRFAADSIRPLTGGFTPKADSALARLRRIGASDNGGRREIECELWQTLGGITCPCLVVRGAYSSVLTPRVAQRMTEEVLPDGQLAIVRQAGHAVMLDNPGEFHRVVERFLDRG